MTRRAYVMVKGRIALHEESGRVGAQTGLALESLSISRSPAARVDSRA